MQTLTPLADANAETVTASLCVLVRRSVAPMEQPSVNAEIIRTRVS
jgi:hypothetical protein